MDNVEFWKTIDSIINNNFLPEGIDKLEKYAELFSTGKYVFKRFSPQEQLGCTAGGTNHVIATIIAGAETRSDREDEELSDIKKEFKRAAFQVLN